MPKSNPYFFSSLDSSVPRTKVGYLNWRVRLPTFSHIKNVEQNSVKTAFKLKTDFHPVVPVVSVEPVLSKYVQAICTIIWKYNMDDRDRFDRIEFNQDLDDPNDAIALVEPGSIFTFGTIVHDGKLLNGNHRRSGWSKRYKSMPESICFLKVCGQNMKDTLIMNLKQKHKFFRLA